MLRRQPQAEWMADVNRYFGENPEMFRAEAAEGLFRREWQRALARKVVIGGSASTRTASTPEIGIKREGFGLGAADQAGDPEWAWCEQCDGRRTREQADRCASQFCKLKNAA
jgi:hypothetical protein